MAFLDTVPARWAAGETFAMYDRQQKHYGYVPLHRPLIPASTLDGGDMILHEPRAGASHPSVVRA